MLNTQLGRIFRVSDPMVEIIYVCGMDVVEEVQSYYFKVFAINHSRSLN
jgi:hypothetical protein